MSLAFQVYTESNCVLLEQIVIIMLAKYEDIIVFLTHACCILPEHLMLY